MRGVIVLERGYDQKAEAAWVKVGISKKTIASAQNLSNALAEVPASAPNVTVTVKTGNILTLPGSHVERSEQKDW